MLCENLLLISRQFGGGCAGFLRVPLGFANPNHQLRLLSRQVAPPGFPSASPDRGKILPHFRWQNDPIRAHRHIVSGLRSFVQGRRSSANYRSHPFDFAQGRFSQIRNANNCVDCDIWSEPRAARLAFFPNEATPEYNAALNEFGASTAIGRNERFT
jgi:hypothetical protein